MESSEKSLEKEVGSQQLKATENGLAEGCIQSETWQQYWVELVADRLPSINLPTDYQHSAQGGFAGEQQIWTFESGLTNRLTRFCEQYQVNLPTLLLSVSKVWLHKYTGQDDLVVGVPWFEGWEVEEAQNLLHPLSRSEIQTGATGDNVHLPRVLPLRSQPRSDQRFLAFLAGIKELAQLAQDVIIDSERGEWLRQQLEVSPAAGSGFELVYQVVCSHQSGGVAELGQLSEARRTDLRALGRGLENCDLLIQTGQSEDGVQLSLDYNAHRFAPETIARMGKHYIHLLEQILATPDALIADLTLLTPAEEAQLLVEFNQPLAAEPPQITIQQLLAEQVERQPDQVAVVLGQEHLTYRELDQKTNQVARQLRQLGVGPEKIVGILTPPSLEMFIGILAVLKAGGAYLPIDPAYPHDRIQYMLADSEAEILLTVTELWSEEELEYSGEVIQLDDPQVFLGESGQLPAVAAPENLAYVIYTSGSTGKPKGVLIENRSLVNLVHWHNDTFRVTDQDRALKYAGVGFDASVWEIFPYLTVGATIYVIPPELRLDLLGLNAYLEEQKITIGFLPTQFCEQFLKLNNRSLRVLLTGGDKLQEFIPQSYMLVNNYGPTENTVVSTSFVVDDQYRNIPIGRPVTNTQVYIVSKEDHLQPVGVAGELCVAGHGIARGYLHRPELTAEKFLPNPFVPGTRMYRTGDLARWLPDGSIEFLGRIDQQVKIRGYRIELGEIENQLLQQPEIQEVVVLDRQDQRGLKYLIAYFVADRELSITDLRENIAQELPDYMIPSYFLQIKEVPLTANGKVDKRALPAPRVGEDRQQELVLPRTEEESRMTRLWAEILGLEQVGVTDQFFGLGGHSLHATQLVARINQEFDLPVQIKDIFAYPTVAELITYLEGLENGSASYQQIPQAQSQDYYLASSNQRRLFAQDQIEGLNTTYNLPLVWQITGDWDQTRLEKALRQLVHRHEALRTYFTLVDGEPVQKIAAEIPFEISVRQIESRELTKAINEFIQPFDLSQGPLFRMEFWATEEAKYLVVDIHHIITDGSSMDIWLKELIRLYAGEKLSPLPIQYKDYSVWQQEMAGSEQMRRQEEYWLGVFADEIPVLNLPLDAPRPGILRYEGAGRSWRVGPELTQKITQLSKRAGVTLYMTLLATYNVLLQKYSGQEDLVVGAPVAGRSHADVAQVFGLFVNLLALRNQPRRDVKFSDFLSQVKENTLAAFANQDFQFETLVEKLGVARDVSRNPLFDVGFIVQNATDLKLAGESWELVPYETPVQVAKFDLLLQVYQKGAELQLNLEYSTHLFKPETIERMGGHLLYLLEQVVADPQKRIGDLVVLTRAERAQLLDQFNPQIGDAHPSQTIQELFAHQVAENPHQVAVVMGDEQLTYLELNQRANQVAQRLHQLGVGPEQIVGILTQPSLEMLIGIWAVLKAGGAYLPIDPAYPGERIQFMLADSQAEHLLTSGDLVAQQKVAFRGQVIKLDDPALYTGEVADVTPAVTPNNLVYVIYTSGSTGKPKGVLIENRSLVNLVHWHNRTFQVTNQDRASKYAGVGFDASVWEIFPYLSAGATIYVIPDAMRLDLPRLNNYLEEQRITISFLPTQLCEQFSKLENRSLRFLLTGGDKLVEYHPGSYQLVNNYGPTENTVVSTSFVVDEQQRNIPIGRPIANTQVYILSPEDHLQPIGVAGELCVGGVGLARGYLNRPKLTQEKFVPNPFEPQGLMYRTGDLARWLPDGNIEFLGRIDQQVQIRGYRIELGEIENRLLQLAGVEEAVVLDRAGQGGEKYLAAFIVAEQEIVSEDVRRELAKDLPEYMIPASVTQLAQLPLTANGKIDRKALLTLESGSVDQVTQYRAPETEVERQLAEIWSDLLQVERIGIRDHFFHRGGHSMLAIKVVTRAMALGWQITVQDLFNYPTIQELAALIEGRLAPGNLRTVADEDLKQLSQELEVSYEEVAASQQIYPVQKILLTGVTGFLGVHLLEAIMTQTEAEVYCLIRGASQEQVQGRLEQLLTNYFGQTATTWKQRISLIPGDLTEARFGLTSEEYRELAGKVDTVLHAAALVKHFGDYADFERVNVQGTAQVIEFAQQARAKLHHISTISIAGAVATGEDEIIFTEKDFYVGQEYQDNVYLRSKFEAEKLILAGMQTGLTATIYRVGNLTGRYRDGQFQQNIGENAFYSLLKSLIQLEHISREMMQLPIEFTPIDFCSRAVVAVMQRADSRGRVLHLQNEQIALGDLLPVLEELGLELEILSEESFRELVQKLAQDADKLDLLSGLMHEYQYAGQQPQGQAVVKVDSSWTVRYLAESGLVWPVADREYLQKVFGYMRKVSFI